MRVFTGFKKKRIFRLFAVGGGLVGGGGDGRKTIGTRRGEPVKASAASPTIISLGKGTRLPTS